jgi:adenylyltransferase/sulfurtransferase
MKEITYQQLQSDYKDAVLIDVRESYEHTAGNLGGINIPMSELPSRMSEVPKTDDVILYCRSGARSAYAIQSLAQAGWSNLINLSGGVMMVRIS